MFQDQHYADPTRQANYVVHAWDVLLPVEDRLPTEVLLQVVPGLVWNHLQGSGSQVPPASEDLLAATWRSHLESVGRRPARRCLLIRGPCSSGRSAVPSRAPRVDACS